MKRSLLLLSSSLMVASTATLPAQAAFKSRIHGDEPLKYAPISKYELQNNGKPLSLDKVNARKTSKKQAKKALGVSDLKQYFPSAYSVGYLDAPDGSTWFYTQDITYTEEELEGGEATSIDITGFTFTIYNSSFEEVGKISDTVTKGENETRIGDVQLGTDVTQKFFNTDSNYELMVMVVANTPEYVNNITTRVYSLNAEQTTPIQTIDGYYVSAINAGTYNEKYYITFYKEEYVSVAEFGDSAARWGIEEDDDDIYSLKYEVYGPASWSNPDGPTHLATKIIPYDNFEGNDGMPMLAVANNGTGYLAFVYYNEPYFKNAAIVYDEDGNISRDMTPRPDNSLVVELNKVSNGSLVVDSETKIPMEILDEEGKTALFYELGSFHYDSDITFNTWTKDGKPSFIVTHDKYLTTSDESTYGFKVYDVEGNKIADICDDVEGLVDVSDIAGYESQQGFYKLVDGEYVFQFINLPSCRVAATINYEQDEENTITSSTDRYPTADSYQYAISMSTGMTDDDDNTYHYIGWFNADGSFIDYEKLPLGKRIAMAQVYVKNATLSPYYFNTDDKREYMLLIKRYTSDTGTATTESLIVINTDGDVLAEVGTDDKLGYLVNISPLTIGSNSSLWISYYNDETDEYTATFLDVPFTKFEKGGDGSSENPFLISSIGDLQQIKGNLTACYKIANDFDAAGYAFQPIGSEFKGVLDGDNHTISNFSLNSSAYQNGIFQSITSSGAVRNINFKDAKVTLNEDNNFTGLIAGTASGDGASKTPSITNIHVYGYKAGLSDGDVSGFGGLVGQLALGASVKNSSISDAAFDVASKVGGIVAETRTGSSVKNCAFSGWIDGGNTIGGIIGNCLSADDTFTNNHVNANIQGTSTLGGIAGSAKRAAIKNNFVEGTIVSTENDEYGYGAMVGGVVGSLAEDFSNSAKAIVSKNVVAISEIEVQPAEDVVSEITYKDYSGYSVMSNWPEKTTTSHRIVGYTVVNYMPDEDGTASAADAGIIKNYVLGDLAVINENVGDGANTTEGESITADSFTETFLSGLGFSFGETESKPWVYGADGIKLYFEDYTPAAVNDIAISATQLQQTAGAFSAEGCTLSIYNLLGAKVASGVNSISTRNLTPGVYIVKAQNGSRAASAKFVVR